MFGSLRRCRTVARETNKLVGAIRMLCRLSIYTHTDERGMHTCRRGRAKRPKRQSRAASMQCSMLCMCDVCVYVCCVAERHYERCVRVYCARHINISFSCQWRSLLVAVWFTLLRTMSGENLWFGGERQIFLFCFLIRSRWRCER